MEKVPQTINNINFQTKVIKLTLHSQLFLNIFFRELIVKAIRRFADNSYLVIDKERRAIIGLVVQIRMQRPDVLVQLNRAKPRKRMLRF